MHCEFWHRFVLLFLLGTLVSACSVTPVALTETELSEQAMENRKSLNANQAPVSGPIGLYEAFARALSHNLDLRLELAERLLAQRELDLARYDELPEFVGNFGFNGRDNFSGASSRSLLTGVQSLQSSTSSDRDVFTGDLNLSWNILDFGVSYIRSKQAADRVLIADEQRRKVVNDLIKDVRSLYWRAVSNDRLIEQLAELLEQVKQAIAESKEIEASRLDKPLTALTYQRELIAIQRELQELQRELSLSKIQLAALMNLEPGTEYTLQLPDRTEAITDIGLSAQMMEELSLIRRSEVRQISYEQRINAKEARAAILQLLPGINLNAGTNYSSNSFLFNNDWLAYGANVSWNLLNVFKLPATNRAIKSQELVLKARRLAMSMAILTQVHVSLAQYSHSKREYKTAADYYRTQSKILEQIQAAALTNSVSQQAVIRERMNTLVAEVKYDIAYADLENAYADMYAAIGVDPVPEKIESGSVSSLSRELEDYFTNFSTRIKNFSLNTFWLEKAPITAVSQ